jgi:superfamily II DNA or RNA helicase
MQFAFDDGTLVLRDTPTEVPYAEWDVRIDEYRAQAYRYRALCEWTGIWDDDCLIDDDPPTDAARNSATDATQQSTLQQRPDIDVTDAARAYSEFALTPAVRIEPREYQQAARDAWRSQGRQGSVILPTGSGKTFLGLQAIADAGVNTLVVAPTIDLMNQWHATLTNAFSEQLTDAVGVLGGGSHDIAALTVTTYDSAYRYINEYGDQFGLLIFDEIHHLPAPTYRQIPEMSIAPYRLGLTATYERADDAHETLDDLVGPVVYEEAVDALAGEYLSEYETIHLTVELTSEERREYDEKYQLYRDYVDSHAFDLWTDEGYREFLTRTSYDPEGRRALIAKQRAETIARTATKKLDTLDTLLKRHHADRMIIFTANNDFAYDISQEFIVPCITHQTKTDERTEILDRFRNGGTRCSSPHRCLTRTSMSRQRTSESSSLAVLRNASMPNALGASCGRLMTASPLASTS